MTAQRIEAMLRPVSVAIVGASEAPGSIGDVLRRNLLEGGFRGPVYLVNPRHASIAGVAAFPDVRSLPQPVDLALIASPPRTVPRSLERLRRARRTRRRDRLGGLPRRRRAGAALERDVLAVAGRYGLRLLGPNSFGVIRTDIGLNAACGGALAHAGPARAGVAVERPVRGDARLGPLTPRRVLDRDLDRRRRRHRLRRGARLPRPRRARPTGSCCTWRASAMPDAS